MNALNLALITALRSQLLAWQQDHNIVAVWLQGSDKALCAGGDIREVQQHTLNAASSSAALQQASDFFQAEYGLYAAMARYNKPIIAWCGGIVMGGGVGVSAHANVRVVTGRSKIGMPEVGIGLIPDVGGTYILSRAPGLLGLHAALSGAPFSGADAIALGFADHYVPHEKLEAFTAAVVGVIAALWPAVRAARTKPLEAIADV